MTQTLWNAHLIGKTYSSKPLFQDLSFSIEKGNRIGLIGPNGSGKSTLLKIVAGLVEPDEGKIATQKGLKVAYLAQDPTWPQGTTLLGALGGEGVRAQVLLSRFGFENLETTPVEALSGGMKKRLGLAQVLLDEPDLLLLDEPTNHLDMEGIFFLEEILKNQVQTWVVISHDRTFLEETAQEIVELDPLYEGGLFGTKKGGLKAFLIQKETYLSGLTEQESRLGGKVRREVEWLRQGVEGRRTKSQSRIDEAHRLQERLSQLKKRLNTAATTAKIDFGHSERKTKKLVELKNARVAFGDKTIFDQLSLSLHSGERYGILGPNGSGKSTLLKALGGYLPLDGGQREEAQGLRIVYFDQMRQDLDPTLTVGQTLAPHGDSVIFQGQLVHVASYARRFLFRQEEGHLDRRVDRLSGGEKARLLMARLMLTPSDLLLLDEPTNDLDIETLESLEENLISFPGCLMLITHDRALLERVSTSLLGTLGQGAWGSFASIAQWKAALGGKSPSGKNPNIKTQDKKSLSPKKPTYQEQREWEQMESRIEEAEAFLAQKQQAALGLATDHGALRKATLAIEEAQENLDRLYERWTELEARRTPGLPNL
jgi:ATP-binding cassette subfamily F protein uup